MRTVFMRRFAIAFMAVALLSPRSGIGQESDSRLQAAIASASRSPGNVARDRYRHPLDVLRFFGIRDNEVVIEIEPGKGYWTEILAPYLKDRGRYEAALPDAASVPKVYAAELAMGRKAFLARLAADPRDFSKVVLTSLNGSAPIAPPNSVDMIMTFRNLHDWMAEGDADATLGALFTALKSGGVLAIEDHRAPADQPQDPKAKSGYVREDYAIALIEKAGFKLAARSEIGANPKDTKDYPAGVWTLPPSLRLGATDRAKYMAIGESDRFTLKFIKP
jgi:predicted methyltransferase